MVKKPTPSKGNKAKAKVAAVSKDQLAIQNALVVLRDMPVILASDLAEFFDTTTKAINQNRARNAERFTQDYAFQLTPAEWENLKSQSVTSNAKHGGTRTPPWAYSEHGVAMMSMGMQSEQAIRLSKVIIDTFVDYRRGTLPSIAVIAGPQALAHRRSLQEKIYKQMEQLLDVELPSTKGNTVRDEIGSIAIKALDRVKAVIDRPALENEKISAEVAKILAEAEKLYAETVSYTHLTLPTILLV